MSEMTKTHSGAFASECSLSFSKVYYSRERMEETAWVCAKYSYFTSFGLYCAINCIVHGHYIIAHFSALLQQDVLLLLLPFYRLFNE